MDPTALGRKYGESTPDRLWEEAKEIFYQDLGQAKMVKLDDTTRLEDTINSLKLAQNKASNEYGTHTLRIGRKDIDIRVGRIMRRLELILQVGDAAMKFGPETVSLVWSAFRMVFTVCLSPRRASSMLANQIRRRVSSRTLKSALLYLIPWTRSQTYCSYVRCTQNSIPRRDW